MRRFGAPLKALGKPSPKLLIKKIKVFFYTPLFLKWIDFKTILISRDAARIANFFQRQFSLSHYYIIESNSHGHGRPNWPWPTKQPQPDQSQPNRPWPCNTYLIFQSWWS
jgi:hypothetical protein